MSHDALIYQGTGINLKKGLIEMLEALIITIQKDNATMFRYKFKFEAIP